MKRLFLILHGAAAAFAQGADGPSQPDWLTAAAFDRALQQPASIFRDNAEARDTIARLAEIRQTACLLDRRIDPSRPIVLKLQQVPLQAAFEELAAQLDARCGRLGDVLIIGPPQPLDRMLTQAAVLQEQLKQDHTIPASRRLQLARGLTVSWRDLGTPREILTGIADQWNFRVTNLEAVPHDLWAAGAAVRVDAVEALSLVLGQFELSFRWAESGRSIEIIPLPDQISIERAHRPRGISLDEALAVVRKEWRDADVTTRGTQLVVTATVLQHEEISRRIGETPDPRPESAEPIPLSRRRFPVRIVRTPAAAVLRALVQQGIDVRYDAEALKASGVNLDVLVTLEFENATAEEFFDALCAPLGVNYQIDGATVTLRGPKVVDRR